MKIIIKECASCGKTDSIDCISGLCVSCEKKPFEDHTDDDAREDWLKDQARESIDEPR